ncbi:uncharacterized protein LACBIDRAFT_296739 [Laccaria bicolor S238N-H82]|uniref:Predicted protein n=1 Tax=Laccaria bicolor (strain S238N-H82 / ATCC MYA-4686) TaxID=486041 RepID=B0E305_LACBS|nr:uncharacterized protein LACBIDRAFT_296739 [Laccaria bicolor S238N-H82]EDQ98771.1 predicted protein [Laccaria bicolor S238N-H82]|eukprot:XP_001890577.1 predicted protein [Laccaria bicolor S238N-H82]
MSEPTLASLALAIYVNRIPTKIKNTHVNATSPCLPPALSTPLPILPPRQTHHQ